jgi:hypothetical protein
LPSHCSTPKINWEEEQGREKVEEYKKLLEELPEETPIIYLDKSFIKTIIYKKIWLCKTGRRGIWKNS